MSEQGACQQKHTPAPELYLQWHSWAAEMAKTHHQTRCPGCGLFEVWIPKPGIPAKKATRRTVALSRAREESRLITPPGSRDSQLLSGAGE